MSLNLINAIAKSETDDDFHLGRLLLLLLASERRSSKSKTVEGITKFAKLDFLLRYPSALNRALENLDKPISVPIAPYERNTVEAKMIRFKYGPWDSRYRRWLGILAGMGLVTLERRGNTVHIGLTDHGKSIALQFESDQAYADLTERSAIIIRSFGSMSATRIKNFIYQVFPELSTMKLGDEILL